MSSYTLRVIRGDSLNSKGDFYQNREEPFTVGQCQNADIRIENTSPYVDIDSFTILFDDDLESWHLVRLSEYAEITINGERLDAIYFLHNNDVITVGSIDLKFNVSSENPSEKGIVKIPSLYKKYLKKILIPFSVALAVLTLFIIQSELSEHAWRNLDKLSSSVYKLEIQEILIQTQNGVEYETVLTIPDNKTVGTAFVTTDGAVITARHCVEPWLAYNSESIVATKDSILRKYVSESITNELLYGDTAIRVVSKIRLVASAGSDKKAVLELLSSDFEINRERDIIVNMGTRTNPEYWRSLHPSYHRKDCALGDIACLRNSGLKGEIKLANKNILSSLKQGEKVHVLGFATTSTSANSADQKSGEIIRLPNIDSNTGLMDDCLLLDDDTSSGDSGGPVFYRYKGRLYVIAIISRRDDIRSEKSGWAVPISEIYMTKEHED